MKIQDLQNYYSYEQNILLILRGKQKSVWWTQKLKLSNESCLIQSLSQKIIQTCASLMGGNFFRRDCKNNLVLPRIEMVHKQFRIATSETSLTDFHKGQSREATIFPNRQH